MLDVLVIGGGPAGVTAALRASELGAKVALVEKSRMGGTCTNDGCVPTRVLAKAARLARDAEQLDEYGLMTERPSLDFEALIRRTQHVVYTIQEKKQLIHHLEESGVAVHVDTGEARFVDPHTIETTSGLHLEAQKFILCTGGHARRLSFPGAELALTHNDVWSLKSLPESVAIIGSAATGCQVGSIFNALGSQVTLLEIAPRILPAEDSLTGQVMQESFERRGMHIQTSIEGVERIEKHNDALHLYYRKGGDERQLKVSAVVLSVGWPGNLSVMNLEAAGVKTERGYIWVDDNLQTSAAHIYAAGDITGRMMLVQSASYEARIAAENAVSNTRQDSHHMVVPHGGFTDPEYGSVGMVDSKGNINDKFAVAVVPYSDLDRAVIDDRTEGFCKLIASRETHQIVGAHVVGEQALEIVHLVAAGMVAGSKVDAIAALEIAYPTYTAVVGLAARRLMIELQKRKPTPQWRALSKTMLSEWEMSSG